MAPIRVAIIGLSSSKSGWAANAHLPYILARREKYTIVGLLNSSVASAQAAIKAYDLPSSIKAYSSPQDLAEDSDVDLVVCATRVDNHFSTIEPALNVGKQAYVEWPLAENATRGRALAEIVKRTKARTVVGLQGRLSPPILALKGLLEKGAIGKLLTVDVRAFSPVGGRGTISQDLLYFADRKIGGNKYTILFAHFQSVVGEVNQSSAFLDLLRPTLTVIPGGQTIATDVPDLVSLSGRTSHPDKPSLTVRYQPTPPLPGESPFTWIIYGEKGEIRLSSTAGTTFTIGGEAKDAKIEVYTYDGDKKEEVGFGWNDWENNELVGPARGVARVYEAFATGDDARLVDFAEAATRLEQLEGWLEAFHA